MKTTTLFLFCLVISLQNLAQPLTFEQIRPLPPAPTNVANFDGISEGSIAFADIDNDNDLDVLITGENSSSLAITKLYTNNGSGSYTEVTGTPFEEVKYSSIAFADVDNDNDLDVLVTGYNNSFQPIAKLYTNNGSGSFTEVTGTPFDGVRYSSIAFADIDNDNDQDVLITGKNNSSQNIAKLYTNNGSGSFTLLIGTPFDGVSGSSIAFSDVDNDNDQDVLITGNNGSGYIARFYHNNGNGGFTEVTGTPFDGVSNSSIAFADVDNDNDQDVLITGQNSNSQIIAKLYTNNGSGGFTEVTGTPFDGVAGSSIAFADIDNDNDQDVLITGQNTSGKIAKLYTNNGNGGFTEVTGTPFDGVANSSIAFADLDNDNDLDVVITGIKFPRAITKLYSNNGNGGFTEVTGTPFDGAAYSSIAFADVDNDNDQDVLITGNNSSFRSTTKLYTNNGLGNYIVKAGTPFDGVAYSSIAFADVDNDNDLDVLITGDSIPNQSIAKLYLNDGLGNFTLKSGTPFDGIFISSIAFSDVDDDNDQDVLITGSNGSTAIAKLYTNNGNGNFTEVAGTPFDGVEYSSIAFADIDNDNDQDVLITGNNNSNQSITKLYTNNGSGSYTEVTGTPFDGVAGGSIAFADVDNDNDQDVLITDNNNSNQSIAKLYTNNGSGSFNLVTGTPFNGVVGSSIAFADVDNDNDQDVLITGANSSNQPIAKLYANNGSGSYTEVTGTPFDGVYYSSIAFADVDNDNDQDVLITGQNNSNRHIAKLYRNLIFPCEDTRDTTNISNCNSYNWLGRDLNTSGTYYDTIPNVAGCDSLMTLNLTIKSIDTSISKSANILYASEKNANYEWIDCESSDALTNNQADTFIVPQNGRYALIISKNACTDTSSCLRVSGIGMDENNLYENVHIFPNPTKGKITLDLSQTQGSFNLKVRDITGRIIDSRKNLGNQVIEYQLKGAKGIYFITLSDQLNHRQSFKVIKH